MKKTVVVKVSIHRRLAGQNHLQPGIVLALRFQNQAPREVRARRLQNVEVDA
jgi:hypothetical protein